MPVPPYKLNDVVKMRKKHPCGGERWQISRVGIDIKLKCLQCGRVIMLSRTDFEKNLRAVVSENRSENI